jgi:hypothetical protein
MMPSDGGRLGVFDSKLILTEFNFILRKAREMQGNDGKESKVKFSLESNLFILSSLTFEDLVLDPKRNINKFNLFGSDKQAEEAKENDGIQH